MRRHAITWMWLPSDSLTAAIEPVAEGSHTMRPRVGATY
jgi:hypothetical protein